MPVFVDESSCHAALRGAGSSWNLSKRGLTDAEVVWVAHGLADPAISVSLSQIELDRNEITDIGATAIGNALWYARRVMLCVCVCMCVYVCVHICPPTSTHPSRVSAFEWYHSIFVCVSLCMCVTLRVTNLY
jgi:hypothetical protein